MALTLFALVLLKPLMVVPDKAVISEIKAFDPKMFQPRQGTRWSVEAGVLVGLASTPEYQASRKDHKGLEPRLAIPSTPQDFAAEFEMRFTQGAPSKLAPFIEFGHHKARISFADAGLNLEANSEESRLSQTDKANYVPDHWYHIYAEQKREEVVVRIDGATLYGKDASFAKPTENGAAGLGFCGTSGGKLEIKDLKIWSVGTGFQSGWEAAKNALLPKNGIN